MRKPGLVGHGITVFDLTVGYVYSRGSHAELPYRGHEIPASGTDIENSHVFRRNTFMLEAVAKVFGLGYIYHIPSPYIALLIGCTVVLRVIVLDIDFTRKIVRILAFAVKMPALGTFYITDAMARKQGLTELCAAYLAYGALRLHKKHVSHAVSHIEHAVVIVKKTCL